MLPYHKFNNKMTAVYSHFFLNILCIYMMLIYFYTVAQYVHYFGVLDNKNTFIFMRIMLTNVAGGFHCDMTSPLYWFVYNVCEFSADEIQLLRQYRGRWSVLFLLVDSGNKMFQ